MKKKLKFKKDFKKNKVSYIKIGCYALVFAMFFPAVLGGILAFFNVGSSKLSFAIIPGILILALLEKISIIHVNDVDLFLIYAWLFNIISYFIIYLIIYKIWIRYNKNKQAKN